MRQVSHNEVKSEVQPDVVWSVRMP